MFFLTVSPLVMTSPKPFRILLPGNPGNLGDVMSLQLL